MVVNMMEFVKQIGLEELKNIDGEELALDFMPAAIAGLADGDFALIHPETYHGRRAELYGESQYTEGRVARAILQAALANGLASGVVYDFQGLAAEYATNPDSPLQLQSNRVESTIRILPEAIVVDGNPLALNRPPVLVLDYGACLTSRSYLRDQMRFVQSGQYPFTYSPLTRMHFTNQTLINTYDADFGRGVAKQFCSNRLYIGREDGVALATGEMINAQLSHGAPAEIADVILCSGTQHTSRPDLELGVANAFTLMREGGLLLVRSLAHPASDEIGTDMVTSWAFEAGFDERNTKEFDADIELIGSLLLTGHFGERAIKTVVIEKR